MPPQGKASEHGAHHVARSRSSLHLEHDDNGDEVAAAVHVRRRGQPREDTALPSSVPGGWQRPGQPLLNIARDDDSTTPMGPDERSSVAPPLAGRQCFSGLV